MSQTTTPTKPTVCVAMSGGVDSSVVAGLLKQRGYDVIGVTMQIWQESQVDPRHAGCCSLGAVEDARRVARILDIPHYVINYKDAFKATVIDEFIDEYERGRTPNPCVTCNRKLKFQELLQTAKELGCQKLATGHYARIRFDRTRGAYRLLRSKGGIKDQSYVLYAMTQDQLAYTMFPLGEMDGKDQIRELARQYKLPIAEKPDSQEICFVSEAGGYKEFLRKNRPAMFEKGELVSPSGEVIGEHDGVAGFTVGQRRGIRIAAENPLYVIALDPKANRVVVGNDEDLKQREVLIEDLHLSGRDRSEFPMKVRAKIRYNMPPTSAKITLDPVPKIIFDEPVRAVTPGQIAVAYRGESVVAGGKIASTSYA